MSGMRTFTCLCLVLSAFCTFAEREMSLGEYAADTRNRVVSKIREALDGGYYESFYQKYRNLLAERNPD